MANERMYLVFKPTADYVRIGKRMAFGWYGVPDNIKKQIEKLYKIAEQRSWEIPNELYHQDNFCIALEGQLAELQKKAKESLGEKVYNKLKNDF